MKMEHDQGKNNLPTSELTVLQTAIARHPFFHRLSADHLHTLASYAMQTEFRSGDLIFRQGDVANRFYLIQEGRVALETERPEHGTIHIQTLGASDTLGWSWLFPPHVWRFSARATEPTRAIFFYGTWLRERCEPDSSLGAELMKRTAQVLIERLQATRLQLVKVSQVALQSQLQAQQPV